MDAESIIESLGLKPHPEGGHFAETWRHEGDSGQRGAGTAIYFLLRGGERSHWHRVDSAEIWHYYAGAPLALEIAEDERAAPQELLLGPELGVGQRPQRIVPPGAWQAAHSLGDWTLVGCTVSPAFLFEHFELAPPNWAPGQTDPS